MSTDEKKERVRRSVLFEADEDVKLLALRGLFEHNTGKKHSINDVIRIAVGTLARTKKV